MQNVPSPAGDLQGADAVDPDGNFWFAQPNDVVKVSPTGSLLGTYKVYTPNPGISGLAVGSDGSAWFTEFWGNAIGRITPGGTTIEYPLPTPHSGPWGIVAGPDGNIWFTEGNTGSGGKIGRITPAGTISEYDVPPAGSGPGPTAAGATLDWLGGIVVGPDSNLWFTGYRNSTIIQMVLDHTAPILHLPTSLTVAATGPNGAKATWGASASEAPWVS